ncbi:MAG TPA: outer membrane lipoprotein LolB [Burkholderiales bacterium]|nr:outer membrane lipoprotein LolB [Burkholderiales bacterium]
MRPALAAVFFVLVVSGCASLEPAVVGKAPDFELAARIAVRYGDEAFSGSMAWRHADHADEMLITTALGAGVARLVRNGQEIVLTTAEPKEYRAADAESLTEQVLGFRLPIRGLANWVRGRPSPELEAQGWKIEYQDFDAQKRPTRLRVTYPNLELRLASIEWK